MTRPCNYKCPLDRSNAGFGYAECKTNQAHWTNLLKRGKTKMIVRTGVQLGRNILASIHTGYVVPESRNVYICMGAKNTVQPAVQIRSDFVQVKWLHGVKKSTENGKKCLGLGPIFSG